MLKRIGTPYAAIRDSPNTFARRDFPKTAADTTRFEELSLQLEPPANRCRKGWRNPAMRAWATLTGVANACALMVWCCSLRAVDNGAYDYAADTHGYTFGLLAEYDD